jgi:hypothetical protein
MDLEAEAALSSDKTLVCTPVCICGGTDEEKDLCISVCISGKQIFYMYIM